MRMMPFLCLAGKHAVKNMGSGIDFAKFRPQKMKHQRSLRKHALRFFRLCFQSVHKACPGFSLLSQFLRRRLDRLPMKERRSTSRFGSRRRAVLRQAFAVIVFRTGVEIHSPAPRPRVEKRRRRVGFLCRRVRIGPGGHSCPCHIARVFAHEAASPVLKR